MATKCDETFDIIYVHPCLTCGEQTGSECDLPTTCLECDIESGKHECVRHWYFDNPNIGWCDGCDREWNLT
jgi:hypothetical protein